MAPATPKQLAVFLPENEEVARVILEKRRSMLETLSDNRNHTLAKAYRSVCASKELIRTREDLLKTKDVGPWVIRLIKESFPESSPDLSSPKNKAAGEKGKKTREPKHYVPEKDSAPYAILVTLYREKVSGKSSMGKQELIDAAEASGLSRKAIGLDKSKAKPGSFRSSHKDNYTGWSCMSKTLIPEGLVKKSGKPAKYTLTEEGRDTARVSLSLSGLYDPAGSSMTANSVNKSTAHRNPDNLLITSSVAETPLRSLMTISRPGTSVAVRSPELACSNSSTTSSQELIQLTSQEQLNYNCDVRTTTAGSESFTERSILPELQARSSSSLDIGKWPTNNFGAPEFSASIHALSSQGIFGTQSSSAMGSAECDILAMPPGQSTEEFLKAYEVVLILDDRETFRSGSKRVVVNICSQFDIPVEIKRLPVGDCIWIARHRKLHSDYVLDFIVERKSVTDLLNSIKEGRYRDQKLRLKECGLRKLIYLVEGDPNPLDASESIETACFTTEILDGFDVQRTTDYFDTERKYRYLTHSIINYYSTNFSTCANTSRVCLTYEDFVKKCCDLKKRAVGHIFALQLMQVPQVTENTACAVTELYPTISSLAQAYSMLDGDTRGQEQMLKNKSKMVNAGASRNIFNLVWGEG